MGIEENEGFFLSMVLFNDYKFSKMGIQENEGFFVWFFFMISNFQKWV